MHFRIHTGLVPHRVAELEANLRAHHDSVQWVDGATPALTHTPMASKQDGALALTTIQDARKLQKTWAVSPGLYFDLHKYDVAYWMPRISLEIPMLNRSGLFIPAGLIATANQHLWKLIASKVGLVFIRPNSGLKPFPGWVLEALNHPIISWAGIAHELNLRYPNIPPEQLVFMAPGRRLNPIEWRFWIVDRQVVAYSPYTWGPEILEWQEAPEGAIAVARQMANNAWQPDIAYVLDVIQLGEGDKTFLFNEINAASTSGLYSVPFEPLFAALRDAVTRELAGDLSVTD